MVNITGRGENDGKKAHLLSNDVGCGRILFWGECCSYRSYTLVCHYIIGYGEKSVVTAFTLKNVALYMLAVVIYTCALYSIVEIQSK